jgi:3-phosphoshikimate 1-carboxyvinyltransferase
MNYLISKENKHIKGEIVLPSSKSISNRLLIIKALSQKPFEIHNLSFSDDTKSLQHILNSDNSLIDVGNAGTTLRFLTSYFANKPGEWIITGSERIQNRPVGILVNALQELGVKIEYLKKEGFPPLKIHGSQLQGGQVSLFGNISSQFISSLLLIAPTLPKGLQIKLKSKIVSKPYIDMTLSLMKRFGIKSKWEGNQIIIEHQNYRVKDITVEADWSSASYWYGIASLASKVDLKLYGLKKNSLQGDAVLAKLFENLGIKTSYMTGGIKLKKSANPTPSFFEHDFIGTPDLVQTFAVALSILNIPFRLNGVDTLSIKETNRLNALRNELLKIGTNITTSESVISRLRSSSFTLPEKLPLKINTYQDHRMALSFSMLSLFTDIVIENPTVVTKSYPGFWEHFQKIGFKITETIE